MSKMLTGYKKPERVLNKGAFVDWLMRRGYTASTAITYMSSCNRYAGRSQKTASRLYAEFSAEIEKAYLAKREQQQQEMAKCSYCIANKGTTHPNHFASAHCESGKKDHCTCDRCW